MAWSQEISQLVTEVDQLTAAVNVKKQVLDSAANTAVAAANTAVAAATAAQGFATILAASAPVYIGNTAPITSSPNYVWIQTDEYGSSNSITIWIEDGKTS